MGKVLVEDSTSMSSDGQSALASTMESQIIKYVRAGPIAARRSALAYLRSVLYATLLHALLLIHGG